MKKWLKRQGKARLAQLRFVLSASNNPLFLGYYRYLYRPKAGRIEAFLDAYSRTTEGTFTVIQIGANDGISNDPIHKFIKRDRWQGVLLEPQPYIFEKYLKKIYAKNKGIHTLGAAIAPQDGQQRLYKIAFSNMRWATGLASFQKESLEKAFTNGVVAKNCKKYNIPLPPPDQRITTEAVQTISPQTLLRTYDLSHIDLLQIDAEGYDYEVIKMFDLAHTQPKAVIFEHIHLSPEDLTACVNHVKSCGYAIRDFGANMLAMRPPLGALGAYFEEMEGR